MKIRIKSIVIHLDPGHDQTTVERFRAIKRRIKAMDRGDLAALLLTAVEKHEIGEKRIGFRPLPDGDGS